MPNHRIVVNENVRKRNIMMVKGVRTVCGVHRTRRPSCVNTREGLPYGFPVEKRNYANFGAPSPDYRALKLQSDYMVYALSESVCVAWLVNS
jgi:hypothetical protein